jgi:hypothetical protein
MNSKDWKTLLWNVLTPLIMDLDVSNISANLSRLILCKAGEMYHFKSPAMIKSGMSPSNFNIRETCSNIQIKLSVSFESRSSGHFVSTTSHGTW